MTEADKPEASNDSPIARNTPAPLEPASSPEHPPSASQAFQPDNKPSQAGKPDVRPGQKGGASAEEGVGKVSLRRLDADIESELEAAMGGLTEKELYGEQPSPPGATRGLEQEAKHKKGKVLSVHGPDIFVDVPGGRSQGVLPTSQFPEGVPAIGSEVEFQIEGYDGANGLLLLTRRGAAVEADWSSIAEGMIVEARVTETNKGGLAVDVNGIRGFMPISQIDLYRVENAEQFVNQRLRCLVVEVKPAERNLVVSRRALLEKEREDSREKLWQELAEGQVRQGIVRSVRDFGAFVDLGGVDGLLHVSEMSWSRVSDPKSVVQPGQSVKVVVLKVDRERRKVSLGLKQLTTSPWDDVETKYPVNSVVKGKITRLMDFGAFTELEPGVEGLIHISELAAQRVRRVADVVQPGQEVQVMVLRADPAQRKISLSLKAAMPKDAETKEEIEEQAEAPKPKPKTVPLRGGIGDQVAEDTSDEE